MRRTILELWKKFIYRRMHFYTWLLCGDLKHCGKNPRFDYPARIENPGSISIGDDVGFYEHVWLNPVKEWAGHQYDGSIEIGDRCKVGYNVQISAAASIIIEEDVAVGHGSVIVDHIHDYQYPDLPVWISPLSIPQPVRISKGAFLGVYCFIGPGVHIGEHAVVAANAVVLKDVPSYCIAVGNPARIVRFHDPDAATCAAQKFHEAASIV